MRYMLDAYYDIQVNHEVNVDGRSGYQTHHLDNYTYFIIRVKNNKAIHMEQALLAYFLIENGFEQTVLPIQNLHGEWITVIKDESFIVCRGKKREQIKVISHGRELAHFHLTSMTYPYEPTHLSSYGQWKELWIEKLTYIEQKIYQKNEENPTEFWQLLRKRMPYLIGISENAISYIQESESETNYDERDQGTIAFIRYQGQLKDAMIYPEDLAFDHMTRDLAEHIRTELMAKKDLSTIIQFLKEYEEVVPLTIFGWRLLYGRLLYPIHLLDAISDMFEKETEKKRVELERLFQFQADYERGIRLLFESIIGEKQGIHIPLVPWIHQK